MNIGLSIANQRLKISSQVWLLRIAILSMIVAVSFWLYSLLSIRPIIDDYGLIRSYDATYFAAVGVLTLAFIISRIYLDDAGWLSGIQVIALAIILNVTPVLLERTPRFTYSYTGYGYVDYIVRFGHISQENFIYHNWPGVQFVIAIVQLITGISSKTLLLWGPLALQAITLLTAYWLFSVLSSDRRIPLLGCWLLLLVSAGPGYLVPGALALLMLFTIVTLLVRPILQQSKSNSIATLDTAGSRFALLVCLMVMVTAHLLTTIVASILIFLLATYLAIKHRILRYNLLVLLAGLLVLWQFFVVEGWTLSTLPGFIRGFFRLDSVYQETSKLGLGGSKAHTRVVTIRVIYAMAFAGTALLGLLSWRERQKHPLALLLPVFGIAAPLSIAFMTAYSGEVITRAFGFSTVFIAFLAALNIQGRYRRKALFVLVFLAPLAYPFYAYGNERIDYVAPSELRSVEFFYNHQPETPYEIVKATDRIWNYRFIERMYLETVGAKSQYLATGEPYRATVEFMTGKTVNTVDEMLTKELEAFHKIYTNQYNELYLRSREH
ncbi:MAG: hypothetical protein M3R24_24845 [Chloroflexota bacterium]|nr:hypothetical protein [Chloroflexota bacterium]